MWDRSVFLLNAIPLHIDFYIRLYAGKYCLMAGKSSLGLRLHLPAHSKVLRIN